MLVSQDFLKGRTLNLFLQLSAGRTKGNRRPHAARGSHFAHPCNIAYIMLVQKQRRKYRVQLI